MYVSYLLLKTFYTMKVVFQHNRKKLRDSVKFYLEMRNVTCSSYANSKTLSQRQTKNNPQISTVGELKDLTLH